MTKFVYDDDRLVERIVVQKFEPGKGVPLREPEYLAAAGARCREAGAVRADHRRSTCGVVVMTKAALLGRAGRDTLDRTCGNLGLQLLGVLPAEQDRKGAVWGTSGSCGVIFGGCGSIKINTLKYNR